MSRRPVARSAQIVSSKRDADPAEADMAVETAVGDETRRLSSEYRDQLREFKATLAR